MLDQELIKIIEKYLSTENATIDEHADALATIIDSLTKVMGVTVAFYGKRCNGKAEFIDDVRQKIKKNLDEVFEIIKKEMA